MDVELQATCSALGYLEGNEYVKEPDCLETVKDLIRFLRRDTDICDIRRQLGHAQIVQNDLVPLVKFYHQDKVLFDTVIKLLVNLTQPVITCFNNEIPDEKTLRNYCLEVESHLQDAKEAFVDDDLFGVLTEKIKGLLKLEWDQRREEDRLQLERLFILVRNVLMIPPDPAREQRTDDDATTHDQILWAIHTSGLEDLLLYVASSDKERNMLCMHVMEIISLMFKEQEAETLASAGVQRSRTEKEQDQQALEQAREKERAEKKANLLKFSARHSRFGGTYVIQNMKSISENDVIYHKPLCEVTSFSYDDGKVPKKIAKNRAPIKTEAPKRRSTLSIRLSLKEFCVQFLINAYNPLMRAVKDCLTRKSAQDNDETYYLWAMRFFMEFCRLSCKRVDLVSETMSMSAFHYIYSQLCTYYESIQMGKSEEAKTWGRRSHLALKAYQELLRTLDFMSKSQDEQIRESAKVIQSNVFYVMEYRDIFITLLKKFKESKSSRAYLRDLVESTHIFLKMLEGFTKKSNNLVVQKKKKAKRKKKHSRNTDFAGQPTEPTEEELTTLWDDEISGELSSLLQGNGEIPDSVPPFDAASEVSIDEQRIETMLKLQTFLRDKQYGEAIALFRAAREVWPERDEFGTEGMGAEEDFMALREIFMASLPRAQSESRQNDEYEGEEDYNEVEEEELMETRTAEESFNFKVFIADFAHPDVLKAYGILLSEFTENSDAVNHCVVKMLHRLAHDLEYVGMLFQASIFKSFNALLNGPFSKLPRYKELSKFGCFVVRKFTTVAAINKKIFVDMLFWKSKSEALAIAGDYDFTPGSKAKVLWTEHEETELTMLYEKYRDAEHPELDTVELIMKELTSSHTRRQVIKELKRQGLIASAKDVKKRKAGGGSRRGANWSEEELERLREAFEQHKESVYPIKDIMATLQGIEKSKRLVMNKIVELALVDDRKQLMKKRKNGESGRRRRRGRDSDSSDDDGNSGRDSESEDSDEGERLFPDSDDGRRGRGGDSSDDDNDENVQLLVRQAAATVGDYVTRLVENGYRDQVEWIQRSLRNVAEDREEGICVPTPIVPLTEENETAMEDEMFLIFLRSLGISEPDGQGVFWRIPSEFSGPDLNKMADGLTINEAGTATGAEEIQNIVKRVFPELLAGGSKSRSSKQGGSEEKEDKKKKQKDKKKKEKVKKVKKREKKEHSKPKRQVDSSDEEMDAVNLRGDENDDLGRDLPSPSSDSDNSEAEGSGGKESSTVFVPKLPTVSKDSDTSDSGLDLDLEAREQERLWKEKRAEAGNDKWKRKLKKREDRMDALKRMMERKNAKNNRKDRKRNREQSEKAKPTLPDQNSKSILQNDKDDDAINEASHESDNIVRPENINETVNGETKSTSVSPESKAGQKKRSRRIAMLDSDSDSNDDEVAKARKVSVDEEQEEPMETITNGSGSKKRALESDSESEPELSGNNSSPAKTPDVKKTKKKNSVKRSRIMQSDDEDNDDNKDNEDNTAMNDSSIVAPNSGDSDKENGLDGGEVDNSQANSSPSQRANTSVSQHANTSLSQHDESLKLHFETSDEEESNTKGDVSSDAISPLLTGQDGLDKQKSTADSFPATLFTQALDSDEEDDHIPLSTAIKRKRAVIEDDEED